LGRHCGCRFEHYRCRALFRAAAFETCLAVALFLFGGGAGFSVSRLPQHRDLIDVDGRFWVIRL
jgi:hypothetical protein